MWFELQNQHFIEGLSLEIKILVLIKPYVDLIKSKAYLWGEQKAAGR